jgi:hypothetical protein
MRLLITVLVLIFAFQPHLAVQQKSEKPTVVKSVTCARVASVKPNYTGLDCGLDDKGQALILDVPQWVIAIGNGEKFNFDIYTNGNWLPSETQPEGSQIKVQPPCPRRERRQNGSYRKNALQPPDCNPELPRQ